MIFEAKTLMWYVY